MISIKIEDAGQLENEDLRGYHNMTDTQLLYFTTIIELGSFSEAALELDISQSSISKQIMQLEDELGVKLFDRTYRKARLTPAGEHLYQDALSVLNQMKHMKEVAFMLSLEHKKKLSLLALPVIGHYNFYIPIQLFENAHPDYDVELEELEEPEMYRRINAGAFDAAITYFNPDQPIKNAKFYPMVEDEMVLVCHHNNPLSRKSMVTPAELDDVPTLGMQKYTCTNKLYEMYFRKHNSNPHIVFRGRPETILVGAEAEQGVALLSRLHTDMLRISNVSLVPFFPPLKGILGMIINMEKENNPLLKELLATLSQNKN